MRSLGFLVLLAGCGDPVTTTELVDEGVICLRDGTLEVDFQQCLSSSCDTLVQATCTAVLDGDNLELSTYAQIESQGSRCTDDCGFVTATCELPEIADSSQVVVVLAGQSTPLDAVRDCQ